MRLECCGDSAPPCLTLQSLMLSIFRLQLKCDGTRWRRVGKWRENWQMEWVASTLRTTSEHRVSSITTADAHTSAANSRLNWLPPPELNGSSVSPKDEIWFLRVCHHISSGLYHMLYFRETRPFCVHNSLQFSVILSLSTDFLPCIHRLFSSNA